jgi:hypothetical protein
LHKSYSLHHEFKKGSPNYNLLIFIHLVHPGCHGRLGPAIETAQAQTKERERIREPGIGEPDRSDPSKFALEKNAEEEDVREWAVSLILQFGADPELGDLKYLQLASMVQGAREEFDFSQGIAYGHFSRMRNPINGFLEVKKKGGVRYLGFRDTTYYDMEPGAILKLHPKRGKHFAEAKP